MYNLSVLSFVFSAHNTEDLPMVDADPLYAKPNKKSKQAKHGNQASRDKGNLSTGRGKNLRKCYNCEKKSVTHFN